MVFAIKHFLNCLELISELAYLNAKEILKVTLGTTAAESLNASAAAFMGPVGRVYIFLTSAEKKI